MGPLHLLYPEMLLSALALVLFLADLWIPARHGKSLFHLASVCAMATLGLVALSCSRPGALQSDMAQLLSGSPSLWIVDPMSLFFKVVVLLTTVLVFLLAVDYAGPSDRHLGSFAGLVLLATLGLMLLVSSADLLMVLLSLELVSICSFILAGFERRSLKSSEGAIKYFLIGAFSSAMMVYGISLYYGATGTTSLLGLKASPTPMFVLSVLLMLVGLGFKASIAPFHLWVPDAYEGAPTPITAWLSVAPKVAALALMLRVFLVVLPAGGLELGELFAFLAMLTMTVGNLTAIFQGNVKRLLAYSSVAQAGYILIGFVAASPKGIEGVLLYSLVYLFMNLGAFTVAIMVGNEGGYELEAYDGLAQRNLGVAFLMTFFLLSLAGIPPTAGFMAKFYLFGAAIEAKLYVLAVVAVLNSVVSVYYYLRIAYHMFFVAPRRTEPLDAGFYLTLGLGVAAAAVLIIGVHPHPFIATAQVSSEILPQAAKAVLP